MNHIRQLDSLRALAVLLVVVSHWVPKLNILPWGEIGVDVFFVLSGFLITGILLEKRRLVNELHLGRVFVLRNFIARRTLRIFPIYYLMILFHYMIADQTGTSVRENLPYYLTYTSNVLFYLNNSLDGIVSHFWSLAVEEQFYLFWPWVILLVPERSIKWVFGVFIILGIGFGMLIPGMGGMLTPACFDAFAIGGGLAFMKHHDRVLNCSEKRILNSLTMVSVILLVFFPFLKDSLFSFVHIRLIVSVLTFRAIYYCLYENDNRLVNHVLGFRALGWLGKVSYGVYIYHTAIPWTFRKVSDALAGLGWNASPIYGLLPSSLHNDLDLLLKFIALLLVSWLSWVLVENPINNLKKYFDDNIPSPKTANLNE